MYIVELNDVYRCVLFTTYISTSYIFMMGAKLGIAAHPLLKEIINKMSILFKFATVALEGLSKRGEATSTRKKNTRKRGEEEIRARARCGSESARR